MVGLGLTCEPGVLSAEFSSSPMCFLSESSIGKSHTLVFV